MDKAENFSPGASLLQFFYARGFKNSLCMSRELCSTNRCLMNMVLVSTELVNSHPCFV